MIARSPLIVAAVAASGAAVLLGVGAWLPALRYGPAALGAACALIVMAALLRALPRRIARRTTLIAGALGFLAGFAASSGAHPWPLGFGASMLPALLLLLAGFGDDRFAFELSRLEDDLDLPAGRPHALARAREIGDAAKAAARALDDEGKLPPDDLRDPRALVAYGAQVAGHALALEGRYKEAAAALSEVPAAWMIPAMRPLMLSNLAFWQLCDGDVDAAKRTLDSVSEETASETVRPYLRATRALVLMRSGELDAALELVGAEDKEQGEPLEVLHRYRITRAHVLAAKGQPAAARAELRRVLGGPGGEATLARYRAVRGPALELIDQTLSARGLTVPEA